MGINGLALLIDPRYADTFPPRSLTYCSELINGKNNGMTSLNSGIFIGAFLSSGVEFLEIVAIAYALAASGFRREALFGSAVGILGVTLAGALLGPELMFVRLRWLQIAAGLVLLYFGWNWTKKSVIRHVGGKRAGWIQNPLGGRILEAQNAASRFSYINFAVMTKSAALETFEVALIVITIGLSSRAWVEALGGASLALALTVGLVVVLHGYLQRWPDVLIKLGAGLILLTLGTYWLVEGLGIKWPMDELSALPLFGLFVLSSWIAILMMRRQRGQGAM
jgi:Ca2+/H+ antiporter, TMEM165/GDT1 family